MYLVLIIVIGNYLTTMLSDRETDVIFVISANKHVGFANTLFLFCTVENIEIQ